ncbi:MAG TPA: two-component sensor histidine kinase, partial [Beijerinckiaceae bacterium]|nr:two-component sensor histidine kinase [Beijerinckiaceae bacterium]
MLSGLSTGLVAEKAAAAVMPDFAASLANLDPQNAIGLATFLGLVVFATATAVLYVREHRKWAERERVLSAELAELRDAKDRAELLTGSERQVIVTWIGRDSEPRFEGDPSIVGPNASLARSLAFGSWLFPSDAS